MLECLILGDSIAVGVGQARTECTTAAQTGITSTTYLKTILPGVDRRAAQVVISLGVNDDPATPTLDNLRSLRKQIKGAQVVWLLPGMKDTVRQAIETVARDWGDRSVDTVSQVGPDHLHPTGTGYRLIASWSLGGSAHPAPANRVPAGEPVIVGNLAQYRAAPVVVGPYTFNAHVIYGSGNGFSAFLSSPAKPSQPRTNTFRP